MKKEQLSRTLLKQALGLILATFPLAGAAQEQAPPAESSLVRFAKQDYLFGDWGGLRTQLKDRGVDFEFLFLGAIPSDVAGGIKEGSVSEGVVLMMMDLYSDKLVGYEGGQFHVSGGAIFNGPEFSKNYVGDLNKVSLLDFPDNMLLWEMWYEQKFLGDKVSLKAGQLAIDRDFVLPEYYTSLGGISLLNQTFFYPTLAFDVWDQPYYPVGNHALASTPYGTPGVRLRVDPSPYAYLQVGAYSGNVDRHRGNDNFPLALDYGALIYNELTFKINQSKDAQGPPGNLKIGGYLHTDAFYDEYQGTFAFFDNVVTYNSIPVPPLNIYTNPVTHACNFGVYFLADQVLWREVGKDDPAQQGLVGFFRTAAAPADRNLASLGIDGGLVYKGLIPGRDWDSLALAGSYLKISDDLRQAQQAINGIYGQPVFPKEADYEAVIELSYRAQLTAWWTVQTSVQRVFHPGGYIAPFMGNIPDAWVIIVQTGFRL
jgi:porin